MKELYSSSKEFEKIGKDLKENLKKNKENLQKVINSSSYLKHVNTEKVVLTFIEFYKAKGLKVKSFYKGWLIICPFHSDTDPSLGVYKDGGCWCFACRKLYKMEAVLRAYKFWLGEIPTDSILEPKISISKESNYKIVDLRHYFYTDGKKSYLRARIDYEEIETRKRTKEFYFYQPVFKEGKQELELVTGYVPLFLYHLLELQNKETVFYVEGEKCADALWDLGLPATTLPIGATPKITKDIIKALLPLQGKTVFVLPDNDEIGWSYARAITQALEKIGAVAKIVKVPELGEKSDVEDYIELLKIKGLTEEEIRQEILSLIEEEETVPFDKVSPKPIDWCIPDWIVNGQLNLIAGAPDVGKTRLAMVLASIKANGGSVWTAEGFKEVVPGKVIYYSVEDAKESLAYWCDKVGINRANMKINDMPSFFGILEEVKKGKTRPNNY